jgi:predicted nucleic acid binding AN1-type Zn finger protein
MTTPHGSSASILLSSFISPPIQNMTIGESAVTSGPVEKPKKTRCEHGDCRVKLGLLGFDCKCTGKYCGKHRYPDQHDCAYNHRAAAAAVLEKQLVVCSGDKLGDRC